ncbi:MAG: polysaccharide biosynthesis tyrosine autokinase [Planctomycetota bacterium]
MTANPLSTIPPIGATTGTAPPQGMGRFKPVDPIRLFRSHALLIVITGMVGLVAGLGCWYILDTRAARYRTVAQLAFQLPQETYDILPDAGASGGRILSLRAREMERLKGELLARQVMTQPEVRATAWYQSFNGDVDQAVEAFRLNLLQVARGSADSLVRVAIETEFEQDASVLLSQTLDVYQRRLQIDRERSGDDLRSTFVEDERQAREDIELYNQRKNRFLEQNNLPTLRANETEASRVYNGLIAQRLQTNNFIQQLETSLESQVKSLEEGPGTPSSDQYRRLERSPEISRIDNIILGLRVRRVERLAAGMGTASPIIEGIDREITAQEKIREQKIQELFLKDRIALLDQTRSTLESQQKNLAKLTEDIQPAEQQMRDLQGLLNQYEDIEKSQARAERRLNSAITAQQDITLTENRPDAALASLFQPASRTQQSYPRPVRLMGIYIAVYVAAMAMLVVLREMLDKHIRSPSDVKLVPNANLLGVVPHLKDDPVEPDAVERVVEHYPNSLLSESFRQVRTNLLSKIDRRGYKTVALVGAQPESGTTSVAQNLVASLAQNGRRAILIDANLQRSGVAGLMRISDDRGLYQHLQGEINDVSEVIVEDPELPNLFVLPAGHPGGLSSELLESASFRSLLGQLESRFDVVVLDCPPALLTNEARIMAKYVDAIAIVVRAGEDQSGMLNRMINQLDGHRADLLGVILNGVKSAAGGYYRKNYQEFFRYRQPGQRRASAAVKGSRGADRADKSEVIAETANGSRGTNGTNGTNGHTPDDGADALDALQRQDAEDVNKKTFDQD